jgi:hypothetical protein
MCTEKLEICIKVLLKVSKKEQHLDEKENLMWGNRLWNVDCVWLSEVMAQHSFLCRGFWTLDFVKAGNVLVLLPSEGGTREWLRCFVSKYWIGHLLNKWKSVYHWFLLKWSQFKLWLLLLRFFMTSVRYFKALLGLIKIVCRLYPLQLIIHQPTWCITFYCSGMIVK